MGEIIRDCVMGTQVLKSPSRHYQLVGHHRDGSRTFFEADSSHKTDRKVSAQISGNPQLFISCDELRVFFVEIQNNLRTFTRYDTSVSQHLGMQIMPLNIPGINCVDDFECNDRQVITIKIYERNIKSNVTIKYGKKEIKHQLITSEKSLQQQIFDKIGDKFIFLESACRDDKNRMVEETDNIELYADVVIPKFIAHKKQPARIDEVRRPDPHKGYTKNAVDHRRVDKNRYESIELSISNKPCPKFCDLTRRPCIWSVISG